MPKKLFTTFRILWIVVSASVLILATVSYHQTHASDVDDLLFWPMLVLGFPLSCLFVGLYFSILHTLSLNLATSYLELATSWLGFFVTGYLQWFKLVPLVAQKLKTHRANRKGAIAR